ncbi:MAG TPA: BamA/TamA family outer membrane protein [Beijerinckiaceae bacterium]|nr:BamA/TamA family outer membrane protein [Beijerinckiaceae bacterium]
MLKRLQQEPPVDGLDLVRRAEADLPKLTDLLWGEGYYSAKVTVEVAGERLFLHGERQLAAARAAERARGSRIVPVRVIVASGPRYAFRSVVVRTDKGRDAGDVPTKLYHHLAGAPAASAGIVEAATRIGAHYRKLGHPFASIEDPEPVIDHASRSVDVVLVVRPGARANIGAVHVSGADGIDAGVIRSFIYAEGEMLFSPERMTEIRRSVARIEAVGSVRVQPRDKLDGDGTVPVDVQVGVRPRHVLGGSARYSNVDGPGIGLYWADRNMFGGAERLRLGADLFYLPNTYSRAWRNRFETNNLGGRLEAGFLKPALGGSRVDFLADAALSRAATEAYVSRIANVTAALRYRFADKTWVQAGAMAEFGQTQDVFGRLTYQLVGLPLSANWDTTDNDLDPTRGFRLSGSVMAAYGAGDIGRFFTVSKAQASAYYALDQDARVILAGRVGLGAASGASVSEIPANWRFFAGGGGSVRGYEYRSIGPRDTLGRLVGGRSLFEASLEARIRATETIGIVPFVDVGAAFSSAAPSFDETLRFGLGVGLRYHTAIGPIRVDVATPLDRRRGEKPVALYISLGQAF